MNTRAATSRPTGQPRPGLSSGRRSGRDGRVTVATSAAHGYTFSPSEEPSKPVGRNTITRMRMVKTTVSPQFLAEANALVEALDESDEDTAEHRAGQAADAAQHGRGERDQAELEAQVVHGGPDDLLVQQAGRAGEATAEGERERDDPVDVDAHQPGRVLVLGDRAPSPCRCGSW